MEKWQMPRMLTVTVHHSQCPTAAWLTASWITHASRYVICLFKLKPACLLCPTSPCALLLLLIFPFNALPGSPPLHLCALLWSYHPSSPHCIRAVSGSWLCLVALTKEKEKPTLTRGSPPLGTFKKVPAGIAHCVL